MANMLRVKLVRSGIGRVGTQKRTLKGMGLTKLQKEVFLPNTPSFRGMVAKGPGRAGRGSAGGTAPATGERAARDTRATRPGRGAGALQATRAARCPCG